MNSKTQPNAIRRQQGIAMMELVIVVPILLLIFLGVSEMGRALFHTTPCPKRCVTVAVITRRKFSIAMTSPGQSIWSNTGKPGLDLNSCPAL